MEPNDYSSVADLYDIYVPATFDLDFFVNETRGSPGEVLELMSGTGRVTLPMLKAGVKLTCVDSSAVMNAILLDKLKKQGLQADVYQMDVRELNLGKRFEKIIIPFHSFAHLVSPADQRKALDRIRQHLLPGGTFICTLGNPSVRRQSVDGKLRFFRKYALANGQGTLLLWILESFNAFDAHIIDALQFYEAYDASGTLQSKRFLELQFRLTQKEEFEDLIRAARFKIQAFYGDYGYAEFRADHSPYMIWKLEGAD
jgi:SAM-dependent methyltransferase